METLFSGDELRRKPTDVTISFLTGQPGDRRSTYPIDRTIYDRASPHIKHLKDAVLHSV
jgi:hypothetical protein